MYNAHPDINDVYYASSKRTIWQMLIKFMHQHYFMELY